MQVVTVATPDHWERSRAVRLAALAHSPDAFCSRLEDEAGQPEAFWRARLSSPDATTVIGSIDGHDVGTMGAGPHGQGRGDGDVILYGVWLAGTARGTGLAEAMLATITSWAREAGHRRILLDVGDRNRRAIAFYTRLGFAPTGVISTFPAPRQHIAEHEMALTL